EHARDYEGDLLRSLRLRLPGCERTDVRLPDPLAVEVPQQRFEDDAQADRHPRDLAEALPLHFRQRIERSVAEALFEVHGGAHIGDLTVRCYSRRGRARPRRLDAAAASECSRARRGSPDGFLHFRTSATVAKPGAGVRAPVRDPAGGAALGILEGAGACASAG